MNSLADEKKYDEENQVQLDHPALSGQIRHGKSINIISFMTKDEEIENMTIDDAKQCIIQFSKDSCHNIDEKFFENKDIVETHKDLKKTRDRLLRVHHSSNAKAEYLGKQNMEIPQRRQSFRDKKKSVKKSKKTLHNTIPEKKKNKFILFVLNLYSAFVVFVKYLFTIQSAVSCVIAISATIYTYFYTVSASYLSHSKILMSSISSSTSFSQF